MTQDGASPESPVAVAGPARTLVMAGAGLAVVVYLLGFFSPLSALLLGPSLLLGGGLLAGAALLPKVSPKLLVPGAVLALVGFLGLVQLAVAASSFAVGGIEIVALVLAFLEAAALVVAVLVEAGVVALPAPKPAAPPGYYQQPYQGGYPPPGQGGGYAQQPNPYAYGQQPQGYGPPQGYPQQPYPGPQAHPGQPPYPPQSWGPSGDVFQPGQGQQPAYGQPAPGQTGPQATVGQGGPGQAGPGQGAPGAPGQPSGPPTAGQPGSAPRPTEAEQTRIAAPTEGRHAEPPAEGERTTKIATDPERHEG